MMKLMILAILVFGSDTVKVSVRELAEAIKNNEQQIQYLQIQNQTYQNLIKYQEGKDTVKVKPKK